MKFELDDYHRGITDAELLSDMRRVAAQLHSDYLTTRQQNEFGKFSAETTTLRFGSWINALDKAGLKVGRHQNMQISNEELFKNLEDIWTKLGHQPKSRDMNEKLSLFITMKRTLQFIVLEVLCLVFGSILKSFVASSDEIFSSLLI